MSKYSYISGCRCASCRKIESIRRAKNDGFWDHKSNCDCSNCRQIKNLREQAELSKRIRASRKASSNSGSSGCFLTTAACTHFGLADDCGELNALRRFRDEYLNRTPEGRELVETYYRISPPIVARLTEARDFELIWQAVARTLSAIETGQPAVAISIYESMVRALQKKLGSGSGQLL